MEFALKQRTRIGCIKLENLATKHSGRLLGALIDIRAAGHVIHEFTVANDLQEYYFNADPSHSLPVWLPAHQDATEVLSALAFDYTAEDLHVFETTGFLALLRQLLHRSKQDPLSAAAWEFLELLVTRCLAGVSTDPSSEFAKQLVRLLCHQLEYDANLLAGARILESTVRPPAQLLQLHNQSLPAPGVAPPHVQSLGQQVVLQGSIVFQQ